MLHQHLFPLSHPATLTREHAPPCHATYICPHRTPLPHTEVLHNIVPWWLFLFLLLSSLSVAFCLCACCILCSWCSQHLEESATCCCCGILLLALFCRRRKLHILPQDVLVHTTKLLYVSPAHARDSIIACIAKSQNIPLSDFNKQLRAHCPTASHPLTHTSYPTLG